MTENGEPKVHEDPAGFLIDLALDTLNQIHSVTQTRLLRCVGCRYELVHGRTCPRCGGGLVTITEEKGEGDDEQST